MIWPAALLGAFFLTMQGALAGSLEDLMADLAEVEERHARFVEKRTLGILDEVLVTEGTLSYQAPDRLIRQDLLPDPAIYAIEGDRLRITVDGREQVLDLDQQPVLAAMVTPFRAMFAGDEQALRAMFDPGYAEDGDHWTITLTPKPSSPSKAFIDRIEIVGRNTDVERMDVHERGGDRSSMTLNADAP